MCYYFLFIEAVRTIKMFEHISNLEIEEPMKVYIAGATYRLQTKKPNIQDK